MGSVRPVGPQGFNWPETFLMLDACDNVYQFFFLPVTDYSFLVLD